MHLAELAPPAAAEPLPFAVCRDFRRAERHSDECNASPPLVQDFNQSGDGLTWTEVDVGFMPPAPFTPRFLSQSLLLLTALALASVAFVVAMAGAGGVDPQCRGNADKKICPKITPRDGATVSGQIAVSSDVPSAVVAIQFKLDGSNLGLEDTVAPYSVPWDTTGSSDGGHALTAVARTADGVTSTGESDITVANHPSDTSAPSVSFTSPASGATVSSTVSVAASASDNVSVVGVQFKLDGTSLGSEDTSSPYSVSWDTTNASNAQHTLTAVARDAAGNSTSTSRTVSVSNGAGSGSSGPALTWAPPSLSNPITINVTNANKLLYLDTTKDYRLNITEKLTGRPGLWIEGGHNVVVVGGHIEMNTAGTSSYWDRTAVKVRFSTGVVHLEGLLIDGAYLSDGIAAAAPSATLQVENVRVDYAHATGDEHPDCLQAQAGVGALRIDRFSCRSELQGFFLDDTPAAVGPCDIRNTDIVGKPGKYLLWQTSKNFPISLSNVWVYTGSPWSDFGYWVYPNRDGVTYTGTVDSTRKAVVSSDGSYLTFIGSNISGRINKGTPSGGDFVPASKVGASYTSPGY
jgi:hypothetical protein